MNQSVIRPGPEQSFLPWLFGEREDSVVVFNTGNIAGERTAAGFLLVTIIAGKVRADCSPALTVISRLKDALG